MKYLKPSEVAAHFRISTDTVRRWCRDGRLPHKDIGTAKRPTYRILASVIEAQDKHNSTTYEK